MEEKVRFLSSIYQHPDLGIQDIRKLASVHEKVTFKKGDFILRKGEILNEYYILKKGLFRSFVYDYQGNDITIDFFAENDILIEVSSLFQRIPTQENIEALSDSVAYKIGFDDFQQLFHGLGSFSEWGRAWMSSSLFSFKNRSTLMRVESAKERYERLLKEKPTVGKTAPLKHIASYLGITDSTLSRIRKIRK